MAEGNVTGHGDCHCRKCPSYETHARPYLPTYPDAPPMQRMHVKCDASLRSVNVLPRFFNFPSLSSSSLVFRFPGEDSDPLH